MRRLVIALFLSLFMAETGLSSHASSARTYIVYLDATKLSLLEQSHGGNRKWHEVVLNSLRHVESDSNELPEFLYVYNNVLSGFAAKLTPRQLAFVKELDGFISAHADKRLRLHTTHTPEFLGMKIGEGLWSSKNMVNDDVIIGFIDTGIWPEHISFHDAGMSPIPSRWKGACETSPHFPCNKKIIGARAFWKGLEAITGRPVDKTPEKLRSARDWMGHGTHTASIAAGSPVSGANLFGNGNGTAVGMHSRARIAAYKVCWTYDCADSDLMAAMDQAVADGVDVLSISLGMGDRSSSPFYMNVVAIASFGAIQKGVFVSCSAGNSGPRESSIDNDSPWIMTVGASDIDRSFFSVVKLGDGRIFGGASLYTGANTGELPIAYNPNDSWNDTRHCLKDTLSSWEVEGKLVLCDADDNDPVEKEEEVKRAGGAGMLLLNREDQGEELVADAHVIPVSKVGAGAAMAIKGYIRSTAYATASISFLGTVYGFSAPAMAAFSSRGPSLAGPGVIKPDLTAPGINILAAWNPFASPSFIKSDKRSVTFNVLSGTSMSSPHVSGIAALLKSIHRDWSPAAIKSAMMTTAYTKSTSNFSISDLSTLLPATPFALGSGHVNPEKAAQPGLVYDIKPDDYLLFMCAMNYTSSQVSIVARTKYSCPSHRASETVPDLNYPSFSILFNGGHHYHNETALQSRTVTNVGPNRCIYNANVREPVGVVITVVPSVLAFSKRGERLSYNVTFVGLAPSKTIGHSFGELVWVCGTLSVRSPIAISWGLHAITE